MIDLFNKLLCLKHFLSFSVQVLSNAPLKTGMCMLVDVWQYIIVIPCPFMFWFFIKMLEVTFIIQFKCCVHYKCLLGGGGG